MDDRVEPHPYFCSQQLSGDRSSVASRCGLLVGVLGLLLGGSPLFYSLYVLSGLWPMLESMSPQPQSVEALGLSTISFFATGIGFAVCCPLALICGLVASQLCSKTGAILSRFGSLLFLTPLPILFAGTWLICWWKGIQFRF